MEERITDNNVLKKYDNAFGTFETGEAAEDAGENDSTDDSGDVSKDVSKDASTVASN